MIKSARSVAFSKRHGARTVVLSIWLIRQMYKECNEGNGICCYSHTEWIFFSILNSIGAVYRHWGKSMFPLGKHKKEDLCKGSKVWQSSLCLCLPKQTWLINLLNFKRNYNTICCLAKVGFLYVFFSSYAYLRIRILCPILYLPMY